MQAYNINCICITTVQLAMELTYVQYLTFDISMYNTFAMQISQSLKHMRKHYSVVANDALLLIFIFKHVIQNTGVLFKLFIEPS